MTETALELQALTILDRAAESRVGLVIRTSDVMRTRQVLNRFRSESQNPRIRSLMIRFSPDDPGKELWLISTTPQEPEISLG